MSDRTDNDLVAAFKVLIKQTGRYHRDYRSKNRQAKFTAWKSFRYASDDILMGLVVRRFSRDNDCIEVDVCLTDDHPKFEDHNGAKAMCAFLFSEAFKSGGSMAIRFTRNVEDGRVPKAIAEYANVLGVELKHINKGYITPYEVRHMYLRLVGFSDQAMVRILELAISGKITTERICYMVCADIYSRTEMEIILLGSPNPEKVLLGSTDPLIRLLYMADMQHVRAALLTTYLDTKLKRIVSTDGKHLVEIEDVERDVLWTFDSEFYALICEVDEPVQVPWISKEINLNPGQRMLVLPRPRGMDAIKFHYREDFEIATKLQSSHGHDNIVGCFILYPRDFSYLLDTDREAIEDIARQCGITIQTCPDSLLIIDRNAATHLEKSRGIRQ